MMANKFIDASLTLCTDPARIDPGLTGNGTNKLGIFKGRMVVLKRYVRIALWRVEMDSASVEPSSRLLFNFKK